MKHLQILTNLRIALNRFLRKHIVVRSYIIYYENKNIRTYYGKLQLGDGSWRNNIWTCTKSDAYRYTKREAKEMSKWLSCDYSHE